jgi:hypothetical protein
VHLGGIEHEGVMAGLVNHRPRLAAVAIRVRDKDAFSRDLAVV